MYTQTLVASITVFAVRRLEKSRTDSPTTDVSAIHNASQPQGMYCV